MVLEPLTMPARRSLPKVLGRDLDSARLRAVLRRKQPASVAIAIPDESQPIPVGKILAANLQILFHQRDGLTPAAESIVVAKGIQPDLGREALYSIQLDGVVRKVATTD